VVAIAPQADISKQHSHSNPVLFRIQPERIHIRPEFRLPKREAGESGEPGKHFVGIESAPGNFILDGNRFCSRSEAACGRMLEKYVPNFRIVEGESFQIPIGVSHKGHIRTVDFKIGNTLIEYHPPRLWHTKSSIGDFKDRDEVDEYRQVMRSKKFTREDKRAYKGVMEKRLSENYREKRGAQLKEGRLYREAELTVAASPEEFYDRVIKRFARGTAPSKEQFLTEFKKAMREVNDVTPKSKKRNSAKNLRMRNRSSKRERKPNRGLRKIA